MYIYQRFRLEAKTGGLDLLTEIVTHKRQILKSASIISIITVVSRILGYVRDQRLTLLLGTTGIADSFVLAYRIPNVLRRLVGEGSMTASFIPVFTDYMRNRSREETWTFANRLFWTFSVVLAGLTVLGVIFSPLGGSLVFDVRKESGSDRSRLSEPADVSVHSVHRDGGAGDGDPELLSCFRLARGHAHPAEYLVYRLFDGGGLEAFLKSGGGAGGGRAGWWDIPVFPAGAATGAPGNEFSIRRFVFGSRECGASRG